MTRPRVLLTGAGGQLGGALYAALDGQADITATRRAELDLRDAAAIRRLVRDEKPDVVINAAAWTAVDDAEDRREEAWAANAVAPGILAEEAARAGAILVHYSTDYVFDGSARAPYIEGAPAAPIGVYGESKLAGEQAVARVGGRALVLRTSWLFSAHGRGFVQTMLRLATGTPPRVDPVRVVADRQGTPTSCAHVAGATIAILSHPRVTSAGVRDDVWATYHLSAAGETTWYAFAAAIFAGARARGYDAPRLEPIAAAAYPTRAGRPAYSVLDSTLATQTFGVVPTDWRAQLAQVLEEYFASSKAVAGPGSGAA